MGEARTEEEAAIAGQLLGQIAGPSGRVAWRETVDDLVDVLDEIAERRVAVTELCLDLQRGAVASSSLRARIRSMTGSARDSPGPTASRPGTNRRGHDPGRVG